jgi:hypothetical protein
MTMMMTTLFRPAAAAALLGLVAAGTAESQAVRGSTRSTARYLEIQPIAQDTVSRERVTERPGGALEFEGFPVFCLPDGFCVFYRAAPQQSAAVFYQDAEFTAWGLGVQGLSATAMVRARAHVGGDFTPPRSDDAFDAVLAYLELNRDRYRVRLGRQRVMSGLGFVGYDGLEGRFDPVDRVRVQAYGGRSLARGLSEPRQRALRGLDDEFFLPENEALLFGQRGRGVDPAPGTSLALRYQFEIWSDRGGMLSERASLNGRTAAWRPLIALRQRGLRLRVRPDRQGAPDGAAAGGPTNACCSRRRRAATCPTSSSGRSGASSARSATTRRCCADLARLAGSQRLGRGAATAATRTRARRCSSIR